MTSKAGETVTVGVVREIVVVVLVRLQLLWIVIQAGMGIRAVLPGVLSTVVGEGEGKEANECRRADASEGEEKEEKKD